MAIAILWQRIEGLIIFVMGLGLFWHWNDTTPWWTVLINWASMAALRLGCDSCIVGSLICADDAAHVSRKSRSRIHLETTGL